MVSVVIPAYNQARFLEEAVASALSQTYSPIEVWVVDNGSSDETPDLLGRMKQVHWVRQDNVGPSGARNRGAKEAKGDIIVFLDGDDVLRPQCVERRVNLMARNPTAALVVGAYAVVGTMRDERSVESLPCQDEVVPIELMLKEMYGPTCGMAVRRKEFLEAGGFREDLRIAEDSELAIRLTHIHGCAYDSEPHAEYRQAGVSLSRDCRLLYDSYHGMVLQNQDILGDRVRYWQIVWPAFRDRMVNLIFARDVKARGFLALPVILSICLGRPRLFGFLGYWLVRFLRNALRRLN